MSNRIEILGVRVDCLSAKEAMVRAMQFMENVPVDTIEILTMETLMNFHGDEAWVAQTEETGLVLPGDPEMLEGVKGADRVMEKEIRNRTFLKMFIKYLQKNHKKVYLLAPDEDEMMKLTDSLRRLGRGICIAGRALISETEGREEEVVNEINGTETDCIISVLPSPYQEMFIGRNRSLLNVKLWLGCGAVLAEMRGDNAQSRVTRFFQKFMFRRQLEREQKKGSAL